MSPFRIALLTLLSMLAFAGNSLLGRLALTETNIDAVSFSTLRLLSGALMLGSIAWFTHREKRQSTRLLFSSIDWLAAFALFVYAASFSLAYIGLTAATGALVLFGAVQATMIGYGMWQGERLNLRQSIGLLLALVGITVLLLPGVNAPPAKEAALILLSGIAWGVYSIRGKAVRQPVLASARNFLSASFFAVGLSFFLRFDIQLDTLGCSYAIASGALASGVGYILWYSVLPHLRSTSAAAVQLSVPPLTALTAALFLGEPISVMLIGVSVCVLSGIAMVIYAKE